tara:strand:+ start:719 stop:1234 length:516 start_codon:yes stop_codon:yes gene_type:complete
MLGINLTIIFFGILIYSSSSSAEKGYGPLTTERFIDHGNNTVTDTKTNLMWVKQDSYLHKKKWMNWFEAQDYIDQLNVINYAGYSDWRIPELEELRSLYEKDKFNSAQVGREMKIHIDPVFAKKGAGSLWSSKDNGRFNAYGVIFNNGKSFSQSKKSKSRKAVRAVRNILL